MEASRLDEKSSESRPTTPSPVSRLANTTPGQRPATPSPVRRPKTASTDHRPTTGWFDSRPTSIAPDRRPATAGCDSRPAVTTTKISSFKENFEDKRPSTTSKTTKYSFRLHALDITSWRPRRRVRFGGLFPTRQGQEAEISVPQHPPPSDAKSVKRSQSAPVLRAPESRFVEYSIATILQDKEARLNQTEAKDARDEPTIEEPQDIQKLDTTPGHVKKDSGCDLGEVNDDDQDDDDVTLTEVYSPVDIEQDSSSDWDEDEGPDSPLSPILTIPLAALPTPAPVGRVLSCILEETEETSPNPRIMSSAARQCLTSFLLEASPPVSPAGDARLSWSARAMKQQQAMIPTSQKMGLFPTSGLTKGSKMNDRSKTYNYNALIDQQAVIPGIEPQTNTKSQLGNTSKCEHIEGTGRVASSRFSFDHHGQTSQQSLRSQFQALKSTVARILDLKSASVKSTPNEKFSDSSLGMSGEVASNESELRPKSSKGSMNRLRKVSRSSPAYI